MQLTRSIHYCRLLTAILLAAGVSVPSFASSAPKSGFTGDIVALVRRTAANENEAHQSFTAQGTNPVRFTLHKKDVKGTTTKQIVETRDGSVARLTAINDMPLSPTQEQVELARLHRLIDQPLLQDHRRRREKEDTDRADKLMRIMPEAFIYSYEGMAQGTKGAAIKLHFKPNPNFVARDQESRVATGMEGELWIDQAQERMERFDAHLFQDVDFGWGILGRLNRGGSIHLENADIGHHNWRLVKMNLDLTGKALMVRVLTFRLTETASDFQPVPKSLSYEEAIRLLMQSGVA